MVTNDRQVRGARVNGTLANGMGWSTTVAMSIAAIALLISFAH